MLKQLSDRIFYLPSDDTTDRPNLGYVLGKKHAFSVDAGNSAKHARLFLEHLADHDLPVPSFVGLTHWHWDHTYGMVGFKSSTTVACERTNAHLRQMMSWNWDDDAMKGRLASGEDIKFCDTHIRREYPDRSEIKVVLADILFDSYLSFNLGGIRCELIRIENSHSDDCCVVYVPEEKLLFAGDIHGGDFHHGWPPKYYPDKLATLMEELEKLDFTTVVPGHDEPQSKEVFLDGLKAELGAK